MLGVMFWVVILIPHTNVQTQDVKSRNFVRAVSYLRQKNKQTFVYFDENAENKLTINAKSLSDCVLKCQVSTGFEARGINYVHSSRSCSCFCKRGFGWNVTVLNSTDSVAFVSHDCPVKFDYLIEQHKCYKMQYRKLNWYDGRALCNSFSSSHPITLDDEAENDLSILYVRFTIPSVFEEVFSLDCS
ncbi:hypothetical protein HELRODRAFT_178091 [Helobdella robusta]|uniref:C-type lectin domain-containing protein n=1 Tax=Helobdella robusta TaxID=6412 RepID=T1FCQ2_HELRO|nr:hypothetical protein HELRODRAFT_178091 [Helobdella robusta]ESN97307.1 hypothetical protein HELRODRAFT_178091 [Helobdella robusta]